MKRIAYVYILFLLLHNILLRNDNIFVTFHLNTNRHDNNNIPDDQEKFFPC